MMFLSLTIATRVLSLKTKISYNTCSRLYSSLSSTTNEKVLDTSNNVLVNLQQRGLISNHTSTFNHLSELLQSSKPVCVYAGFDPTADSLHAGNLLVLMGLLHFQRSGHKTIALVGGATGQVGDPSGRTTERQSQEVDKILNNANGIHACMKRVFENSLKLLQKSANNSTSTTPPTPTTPTTPTTTSTTATEKNYFDIQMVDNLSWYSSMNTLEFVRNVGQHFRISSMLGKESVKSRLSAASTVVDTTTTAAATTTTTIAATTTTTSPQRNENEGMSFTEFTYQIFQAYDFYHLFKTFNCTVQLGGSDQWGNITGGCDLIRKTTGKEAHAITLPLVTTATGEKFGKSMGNAVWMSKEKTSYLEWYQFFIRTEDRDVEKFLRFFTFLSIPEIEDIMKRHWVAPEKRVAQRELANYVTELVHGEQGVLEAQRATVLIYGGGSNEEFSLSDSTTTSGKASPISQLSELDVKILADNKAPQLKLSKSKLNEIRVADVLASCGLTASKSEARKLIKSGGVSVNGAKVTSEMMVLDSSHVLHDKATVLKVGKRNYGLILWEL